ncbi:hypothetical protein Bccel_4141 [Pseudobacteroides cellulosolvens ATCC 35603 = DSM 2933]|uniref:STAS/SEC14 domain-containing protein n=2 Tax=Pseudobacteroides cellulosolvens TaxID=35825 RepID=A0A0L6JTX1_9FIRM|nr:hypothetical protein Bccel_4141 [Pseudobacteroides cellulosolvens ATCC 35603 = DSM 2933]
MNKSPSGSLCPYYYMGGELHPLKYGSYFKNKDKLFAVMKAEEEFILKSPGLNNRRIWIDLYETTIDDEVIDTLVLHIITIRSKINKLCLVGCSILVRCKIRKQFKARTMDIAQQIKFFSDPEEAKQWLIGKPY